jgi:hypothetical protein
MDLTFMRHPPGGASEKPRVSLFLFQATLYIGLEAHFMRLVTPLRDCIDARARTTLCRKLVEFRSHGHLHPVQRNRPGLDPLL